MSRIMAGLEPGSSNAFFTEGAEKENTGEKDKTIDNKNDDLAVAPHGGDVFAMARALNASTADLLDFSANINPLGYPDSLKQAALDAFDLILHYPDPDCLDLKRDIAAFHGRREEEILVGNGSTELIYLLVRALRPEKAVVVAPAFTEYQRALALDGVKTEFDIIPEEKGFFLDRPIEAGHGDIVFLANPGNPSGRLLYPEQLLPILDKLAGKGCCLVLDEAFIDFEEEASIKGYLDRYPRLVILRSFTKFFGIPGIRLGFMMAAAGIVRSLKENSEPWSVNVLAQVMGRACLKETGYMAGTREYVREQRDFLAGALSGLEGLKVFPGQANYLLIKLEKPGLTAAVLKKRMFAHHIIIRDASNFVGLDRRFIRLAVRTREENERCLAALKACLAEE